jgi:hypothetical protein
MDIRELEDSLKGHSYAEIDRVLADAETRTLMALLDSKSIRIGDSAAGIIARRRETDAVVDAILAKSLRTKLGKIRALSIIGQFGKKCPRSTEAHLALMEDKNPDVVSGALWGLVFLQDVRVLPAIRSAMDRAGEDSEAYLNFELAIEAIESRTPFIFSPGFSDHMNVWELRKER